MTTVHVIPVPDGYTPDEAFEEISVMGKLVDREVSEEGGCWAVIVEEDDV